MPFSVKVRLLCVFLLTFFTLPVLCSPGIPRAGSQPTTDELRNYLETLGNFVDSTDTLNTILGSPYDPQAKINWLQVCQLLIVEDKVQLDLVKGDKMAAIRDLGSYAAGLAKDPVLDFIGGQIGLESLSSIASLAIVVYQIAAWEYGLADEQAIGDQVNLYFAAKSLPDKLTEQQILAGNTAEDSILYDDQGWIYLVMTTPNMRGIHPLSLNRQQTYDLAEKMWQAKVFADKYESEKATIARKLQLLLNGNPVITTNPFAASAPATVSFSGATTVPPQGASVTSYAWTFSDGTSYNSASVSKVFLKPGSGVYATLTCSYSNGKSGATSASYSVGDPYFQISYGNVEPRQIVVHAPNSPWIASCAWSFGDGATGVGIDASHLYAQFGRYTCSMTLTLIDGSTIGPVTEAVSTGYNGPTYIQETVLHGDYYWTARGSPYILPANTTIAADAKVTVGPGTVIKFADGSFSPPTLVVNGTLDVRGTASSPCYLTSVNDDTVGGDVNGDGQTGPLYWRSISVSSTGIATLANAVVRYGGAYADQAAALSCNGGKLSVTGTKFQTCSTGVSFTNVAGASFIGNSFDNSSHALSFQNCPSASLSGTRFSATGVPVTFTSCTTPVVSGLSVLNSGGLHFKSCPSPSVTGSTFDIDSAPISVEGISGDLVFTGNTALNKTWRGIRLTDSTTLTPSLVGNTHLHLASFPYMVQRMVVPAGITLTLDPGVVVKFDNANSYVLPYLEVDGSLSASGTTQAPIIFTAALDNTWGGTAMPGQTGQLAWGSISVSSTGSATLANAVVRYGGAYSDQAAAVSCTGGCLRINTSRLEYCGSAVAATNAALVSVGRTVFANCNRGASILGGSLTFQSNILYRCSSALDLKEGVTYHILNCDFVEGGTAIAVTNSKVLLQNNLIVGNSTGIQSDASSTVGLRTNDLFANSISDYVGLARGGSDLALDPLLLKTEAGNFRLAADSPCIDTGSPQFISSAWLDYYGEPRTLGTKIDIGASEHVPTAQP
jgi:hypothetical protein